MSGLSGIMVVGVMRITQAVRVMRLMQIKYGLSMFIGVYEGM